MSKEMNIEESIKVLEKIKEMFLHLKNYGWIEDFKRDFDTDKTIQAIETVLADRERLIKDNYKLDRENQKLFEIQFEYISKDKIKEKIEELKNENYQISQESEIAFDSGIMKNNFKIQVLQELLEGRE